MNMRANLRTASAAPVSAVAPKSGTRAVLTDGCVVVAKLADDAHGQGIRCRVMAKDGVTERADFLIEIAGLDWSAAPRLTALPGGGFRLGWLERTGHGAKFEYEDIRPVSA